MPPYLDLLGIVVADMAASLAFYRRLGLAAVELVLASGLRLAWDTHETIRSFDDSWTLPSGGHRTALAFACDSP